MMPATFPQLSFYFHFTLRKPSKMGPTLRAAHKNFTPTDLYAVGVFFAPNFAPAITKKQWLQEFFLSTNQHSTQVLTRK